MPKRAKIPFIFILLILAMVCNAYSCNRQKEPKFETLNKAIENTLNFLEDAQLDSGEFPSSFCHGQGRFFSCESDHSTFPTTFVLDALAGIQNPKAKRTSDKAAAYLLSIKEPGDLWRYWQHGFRNSNMPYDLDDTACARAALIKAGKTTSHDTKVFLKNKKPNGAFTTWVNLENKDIDCAANANILYYLSLENSVPAELTAFLQQHIQIEQVRACNIWYKTPLSFYYFMARAIRANTELEHLSPSIISELENFLGKRKSFGNALEHALGTAALCILKEELGEKDISLLSTLLNMQNSDGSFAAEPFYIERQGTFFESKAVTSAFALDALSTCKNKLSEEKTNKTAKASR